MKEQSTIDISLVDELNEVKAILTFLNDSIISILTTCEEKPPLIKTPYGISLVFNSIFSRLDAIKETIDQECKTQKNSSEK